DVVVMRSGHRLRVGPGGLVALALRLERGHDFAVAEDVDLFQVACAVHHDLEGGRLASLDLIALDRVARAEIDDDVVGGAVDVTFLYGVEDALAVVLLGDDHAIGDVRGPVVARGLEAELVPLLQGVADEALGKPAGDVGGLLTGLGIVAGARRVFVLVRHAVALIDLDDRLDDGVVVAPVGAHARGAGVAGTDAV